MCEVSEGHGFQSFPGSFKVLSPWPELLSVLCSRAGLILLYICLLFRNTEVSAECKTPQPNIPAENCEQILTEKKGPGSIVLIIYVLCKILSLSQFVFVS